MFPAVMPRNPRASGSWQMQPPVRVRQFIGMTQGAPGAKLINIVPSNRQSQDLEESLLDRFRRTM